jgi:hypothetical protein
MNSVIGSLRANLGLDSAQFERGAKRSQSASDQLKANLAKMGAAAVAAGAALAAMAQRGAAEVDRLAKAGRRIDTTVTGMRALELAAGEAGVSVGSLTDAVQNLDREVASGGKGAAAAMERLGISAKDLQGLEADQKLALIADRVKEMGLSTGEATALLREFGIRNRDMILLLMQGGDALRNARNDIQDYGLAMSRVDAAAIETANDQIGRLRLVTDFLAQNLARVLIPAFGRLAERITDSLREGGLLRGVINAITRASMIMAQAIDIVTENLDGLVKLFAVFVGAKIVTFIFAVGRSFIALARIIRTTGLVMMAFSSIARAKITTIALLGAVVAKVTGQMDNMTAFIQRTGAAIMEALPADLSNGVKALGDTIMGLGKDIDSLDDRSIATMTDSMINAAGAANSFGNAAKGASGGVRSLNDQVKETPLDIDNAKQKFEQLGQTIQSSMEQGFMAIFDGTKKASGAFKDMARQILAELFRVLVVQRVVGSFGGGGILGAIGGAFGIGKNANGTTNWRGGLTMVGERGPELVNLPRGSQVVDAQTTAGRMGVGDVVQHFNFNLAANGDESVRRIVAQAAPQIVEAAKSGVLDARRRGGSYRAAFG